MDSSIEMLASQVHSDPDGGKSGSLIENDQKSTFFDFFRAFKLKTGKNKPFSIA